MITLLRYQNRKGVMFILTMAAFSLVMLFTFIIMNITNENVIENISYGDTIGHLDQVQFQTSSFEFTTLSLMEEVSNNIKLEFIRDQQIQKLNSQGIVCFDSDKLYLYDESVKDINITDDNGNVIRTQNGCLVSNSDNLTQEISNSIKQKLEVPLERVFNSFDMSQDPSLSFTNNSDELRVTLSLVKDIEVRSLTMQNNQPTIIQKDFESTHTINLNSFPDLISSLHEDLPSISQVLEVEVPLCISNNLGSREECITSTSSSFISSIIPSSFNSQVKYISTLNGLVEIEFTISEDSSSINPLVFRVKVEDKIPLGLVDFELNPSTKFSDAASLKVFKPDHIDETLLHGYVILYSYENFFDPTEYGQSRFDKLYNLLDEGLIPSEFERFGSSQLDPLRYYMSKPSDNLDLNMIFVPWRDVPYKVQGSQNFFEVDLYQIYNFNTMQYDRISSSSPLYAFVFAVGVPTDRSTKYNYFVDPNEFSSSIESISIQSVSIPQPISSDMFTLSNSDGSLDGLERGFSFSVSGYQDTSAQSYSLFLVDSSTPVKRFSPNCQGINNCYYYNLGSISEPIIITSLPSGVSSLSSYSSSHNIISSSQFRDSSGTSLSIENSKTYQLGIVPITSSGEGLFESESLRQGLEESEFDNIRFYAIEDLFGVRNQPLSRSIFILDKRAPDPISSITVQQSINVVDGGWQLTWLANENEDIQGLYLSYEELDVSGSVVNSVENEFFSSRPTLIPKTGESIRVTKIIPQDDQGNFNSNPSVQTHTAQFIAQQQTTTGD